MIYYVSTTGSDTNDGGVLAPFLTINKARGLMNPGDTCVIRGGTYKEQVIVTKSGLPDAPITFSGDGNVVIDCEDVRDTGFTLNGVRHIIIANLEVKNGRNYNVLTVGGGDNIIRNVVTRDNGYGNPTFAGGGIYSRDGAENMTIEDCKVYRTRTGTLQNGIAGIFFWKAGGGHKVLRNLIDGRGLDGSPQFYDGISGGPEAEQGSLNHDSEWAFNEVRGCYDDGISGDGPAANSSIHDNFVFCPDARSALSAGPIITGPLYVFRNIWVTPKGVAVKYGGTSPGEFNYYHNTAYCLQGPSAYTSGGGGNTQNHHYRNNAFYCFRYLTEGIRGGVDFDGDLWFTEDQQGRLFKYNGQQKTFAQWQALGFDVYGQYAIPQFVNPGGDKREDYALLPTSPAIDTGIFLSGWPGIDESNPLPDIGAIESGLTPPPIMYNLRINDPVGQGTTDPPTGSKEYEDETIVPLTAIPADGWKFVKWDGDIQDTTPSSEIIIDRDTIIWAVFEEIVIPPTSYSLTIEASEGGITFPEAGSFRYLDSETETISAYADAGYIFNHWEGDVSGTNDLITVTIHSNMLVKAVFIPAPPEPLPIWAKEFLTDVLSRIEAGIAGLRQDYGL